MIGKRITSAFLALTTMVTAIPFTATAAESNNVYISISYDGQFINGKEGNTVAYSAVSLDQTLRMKKSPSSSCESCNRIVTI